MKESLISEVENFNFDSQVFQDTISSCEKVLLYSWDGYKDGIWDYALFTNNFIDAGAGPKEFKYNETFMPNFNGRSWALGTKPNGEVYDKEKGEPFLIVGKAAGFRIGDTNPSITVSASTSEP